MTAWDELTRVRADLKSGERTLDDLWHDRPLLWQGLAWSRAQLRLWLHSLPGIAVRDLETDNPAYCLSVAAKSEAHSGDRQDTDLGALIAEVLAALGKPAPLALVRAKLPPGLVATESMIRAAVQSHPRLALTGPLIRLLS
jgi:hypothetical protein